MSWEAVSWVLVVSSLIGNIFIIKKHVFGQWLWAVSDLGWIFYNIHLGATAQAFLFFIYTTLCIWGIITWSRESNHPIIAP
ncbi:MAG TPA: hypothetical protein VFP93_05365 [Gammaproteobacteria bacterium]|nr:hypothetical protein [Gammaproteobacteria bacterium]